MVMKLAYYVWRKEDEIMNVLNEVGVNIDGDNRSATMVIQDDSPVYLKNESNKMELMPIIKAFEKYPDLRDSYYFNAVSNEELKHMESNGENINGYFLRVHKNSKVKLPCQIALYMGCENSTQKLHNIVIVEEGAELELITGCLTNPLIESGEHFSVDEYYVKKNAVFVNTMVHSWGKDVIVKPISATVVEDGGHYEHRYVVLRSPKKSVSNPVTYLNGDCSTAKFFSVILGSEDSEIEVGGDVYLRGKNSGAELVHRGISNGGKIFQKGMLVGDNLSRAHVDCGGVLMGNVSEGIIESIPGLKANHKDALMSHEASIGRISPEQVEYLMSRGMEEKEALALLIRGFVGNEIKGLGNGLDERIAAMSTLSGHGEMEGK